VDRAIEDAVATLAELSARYADDIAPRIEQAASLAEIAELQEGADQELPASVLAFLKRTRAIVAMEIRNGYWIGGPAELSRSMRRHDYPTRFDADGQTAHAIPFATDGGGNAFMITAVVGSVWRWDHETGTVAYISEDLAAFLRRVAEDWAHDLDGDDAWKYLV
jgi:hypothetical protein